MLETIRVSSAKHESVMSDLSSISSGPVQIFGHGLITRSIPNPLCPRTKKSTRTHWLLLLTWDTFERSPDSMFALALVERNWSAFRSIGWELPGHVPFDATSELVQQLTCLWKAPSLACFNNIYAMTFHTLDELVHKHFGQFPDAESHIRFVLFCASNCFNIILYVKVPRPRRAGTMQGTRAKNSWNIVEIWVTATFHAEHSLSIKWRRKVA